MHLYKDVAFKHVLGNNGCTLNWLKAKLRYISKQLFKAILKNLEKSRKFATEQNMK